MEVRCQRPGKEVGYGGAAPVARDGGDVGRGGTDGKEGSGDREGAAGSGSCGLIQCR
jgi:hypothetical protein